MTDDAPDIHALSGAYALNALEPQDKADFERHLQSCTACEEEVLSLREAVAALADGASEAPPERLRSSVLAGISEVRPLPPIVRGEPVDDQSARRRKGPSAWLLLAAAVLGVIALGAGWRAISLQQQVTQLTAAASDLNSLLTAPDATTVTGPVASGGQATVVISRERGMAALATAGLDPAPAGHVYQAWFIPSSGSPVSAGFVSERAALALLTGSPANAAAVGVTVEPEGGSAAPTTTPLIAIPLPANA